VIDFRERFLAGIGALLGQPYSVMSAIYEGRTTMDHVNLGDLVKDRISGYEGVAIAKIQYLTGCDQVGIKPRGTKPDGGTFDTLYFDAPFVEVLEKDVVSPVVPRAPNAGGPGQIIKQG
jgi:hypothetical protein